MKKKILALTGALFCMLFFSGCDKTGAIQTQQPAQEQVAAAPEKTPPPAPEPAPLPEPEPLPAGEEILLFGERVQTLADGETIYVESVLLAERAGLSVSVTDDCAAFSQAEREVQISLVRADALGAEDGFWQAGRAYVPVMVLAERFDFASGTAEDGTAYFAKELTLKKPVENVNVPVLMYHAVSDDLWGYWDLFVSPKTMEEQLSYLQENGYQTIWFEDLSHIEDYEKPVILTFDDGYDDNYTELFPLLQKYNAKATIFVIPKAIGTPHKMTAEQVYELSQSGLVSIQSHTYSHGNLSTMDEQTLIFEMEQSKNYLAALTGQVPYAVCYPEGTRSELSIEVAGRYYAYGLLMNGQLYNTADDPMRVKRYYVPRGYDIGSFVWSVQDAGTKRAW